MSWVPAVWGKIELVGNAIGAKKMGLKCETDSKRMDLDCIIINDVKNSSTSRAGGELPAGSRKRPVKQLFSDIISKELDSDSDSDDFVLGPVQSKRKKGEIFVYVDDNISKTLSLASANTIENILDNPSKSSVLNSVCDNLDIETISSSSETSSKVVNSGVGEPFKTLYESSMINNNNNVQNDILDVETISSSSEASTDIADAAHSSKLPAETVVYEVEAILDFIREDNVDFYLVKWKGWMDDDNSWEPAANLEGCQSLIKKFHRLNPYLKCSRKNKHYMDEFGLSGSTAISSKQNRTDRFLRKNARIITTVMKKCIEEDHKPFFRKAKASTLLTRFLNSFADDNEDIRYYVTLPEGKKRITMNGAKFKRFVELKTKSEEKLKDWQDEINKVSMDPAPIVIINDVDLEYAPESFTYINDYEAGEGIVIPDDPLVGCECSDCLKNHTNCCGHQSGSKFAYTRHKKLKVLPGSPIYECNKRCSCGPECVNRVVQHGRKMKLAIFRTMNMCGWGVKTLEPIPKGSFVMEYVGEVITSQEAEKRGQKYDAEGRTYLFDLDYDDGDCPFTVDAAYKGNISHFMNHSCEPNLAVYGVWINSLDPRLPRLAFFSTRDIKRGEELSFDYMMSAGGSSAADTSINKMLTPSKSPSRLRVDGDTQKRVLCKCGSGNCRKYLF